MLQQLDISSSLTSKVTTSVLDFSNASKISVADLAKNSFDQRRSRQFLRPTPGRLEWAELKPTRDLLWWHGWARHQELFLDGYNRIPDKQGPARPQQLREFQPKRSVSSVSPENQSQHLGSRTQSEKGLKA